MSEFVWFLIGFAVAALIAVLWFHGNLKPQLDELKKMAAAKLSRK